MKRFREISHLPDEAYWSSLRHEPVQMEQKLAPLCPKEMSRATRRQRLEAKLKQCEGDFSNLLHDALRKCVLGGEWGLFGQNDAAIQVHSPHLYIRLRSETAVKLLQLGEEITAIRASLGMEEHFRPLVMYQEYRRRRGPNDVGEPRLAATLLADLQRQS